MCDNYAFLTRCEHIEDMRYSETCFTRVTFNLENVLHMRISVKSTCVKVWHSVRNCLVAVLVVAQISLVQRVRQKLGKLRTKVSSSSM